MKSLCENCRWYLGEHECVAFPDKIPLEIWKGEHIKPVQGQWFDFVFVERGPLM